jgi:hypothetical protein
MIAVCSVVLFAGIAAAFEVEATIKKVDADKGVVAFHAQMKDHSAGVAKDAKFLDADGKALPDGLKSKALKEGATVVLTIEREDDKPVIHAIRLAKKTDTPPPPKEEPRVDTSKLVPLTDLGTDEYKGFKGGLYPDGKNERPSGHEKAGLALAKKVQPLDADGKPNADGKIVLLGIGFSNTVQCFDGFLKVAKDDKDINPKVVFVNGAVGGMSANMIQNPDEGRGKLYWATVDERLKTAGVTRSQVQAIWLKETNPGPHEGGFPKYTQTLQGELTKIVQILHDRFPNARLVYLSSRTYAGWAKAAPGKMPGNSEPYSYETGFAVKWLIELQLKNEPALNCDAEKGEVKAPWLSWGPYLWANGETKRKDGYSFKPTDFRDNDRMHHSPDGMEKMGKELLRFFKNDTTTKDWFVKKGK